MRKLASTILGLTLILGILPRITLPVSYAATYNYVVDTTNWTQDANAGDGLCVDAGGDCSLRAAIQEANADNDTTAITFGIAGTITYDADIDNINAPITITGPGAGSLTLNCGTATAKNAFAFGDGSEGSIISGGITVAGCTGVGNGIIAMRDDTTISDITISGDGEIKVYDSTDIDNVTISNNTLTGGMEIIAQNTTFVLTNSTISGNSITDATTTAITSHLGTGNTITANTVASNDSGDAIELSVYGAGNSITNNTITSSNQAGIEVTAQAAFSGLTITGNNVNTTANNGDGITFIGGAFASTDINISTNIIANVHGGTGRGIQTYNFGDNSSFTISSNTITAGGAAGIHVNISDNSGLTLTTNNNTVKNGQYGILLGGLNISNSTVTMSGNTVGVSGEANTLDGFMFGGMIGGTLTMNNNTIQYNRDGIVFSKNGVETGFTTATLTNNTVSNNTQSGLKISVGGGYVIGTSGNANTFSSNTQYGIYVNSAGEASPTIAYNTINSNTLSGVYVQAVGDNATISSNTISSNTQNGILIASVSPVAMSSNTISGNGSAVNSGEFTANYFLYTFGGNEYDDDGGNDYLIESDGSFAAPESITADDQTITTPDGTNNFNLHMTDIEGVYVTIFYDAANIDSEAAADAACEGLGMGTCTTSVWLQDVFTANGAATSYTYDTAAVAAAGVTVTTGSAPAWTFESGGYDYVGIRVTGDGTNTFSSNTLSGNGNGYKFSGSAVSQSISDDTVSSLGYDFDLNKASITISLDNVSFTNYTVTAGTLDINYDTRVLTTNNDDTAINGTPVTASDSSNVTSSMGTTDSSGYTSYTSFDAYQVDSTGVINNKNPYSFTASISSYLPNTESATIDSQNETLTIVLEDIPTSGGAGSPPVTSSSSNNNSENNNEEETTPEDTTESEENPEEETTPEATTEPEEEEQVSAESASEAEQEINAAVSTVTNTVEDIIIHNAPPSSTEIISNLILEYENSSSAISQETTNENQTISNLLSGERITEEELKIIEESIKEMFNNEDTSSIEIIFTPIYTSWEINKLEDAAKKNGKIPLLIDETTDYDSDNVSDLAEILYQLPIASADFDNDNLSDGEELFLGTNPRAKDVISGPPEITNIDGHTVGSTPSFRIRGEPGDEVELFLISLGAKDELNIGETTIDEKFKGEISPAYPISNGTYYAVAKGKKGYGKSVKFTIASSVDDDYPKPEITKITYADLENNNIKLGFYIKMTLDTAEKSSKGKFSAEKYIASLDIHAEQYQIIHGKSVPGMPVFVAVKSVLLSSVVIADAKGNFEVPVAISKADFKKDSHTIKAYMAYTKAKTLSSVTEYAILK